MKKKFVTTSIVLILAIALAFYFFQSQNPNPEVIIENNTTEMTPNSSNDSIEIIPKTYEISIENFSYSSETLTINVGDTVVWGNKDIAVHTVTSVDSSILDSGLLRNKETYSYTFNNSGTFEYYCKLHSYMKGKIIVKEIL